MSMVMAKPSVEHGFLDRLVGAWDVTSEMGGEMPWVEHVRSLSGIWIIAEGHGEMPGGGGTATTVLTLGFDATKGKYVGTWLGSMMDNLWVYEGEIEPDGNTLSLYTTGPAACEDGLDRSRMADYRERITFLSDDHRIFTSSAKQPDGSWKQFMEADYRRKG